MAFTRHLKYRRIIESIVLIFFIYKTLKQINKAPIECSRECVLLGRGRFFRHYERTNFATKQLRLVKKPQPSNKNGYEINKY